MIGQQSGAIMIYIFGILPLILVFTFNIDVIIKVLVIASIFLTMMAICWVNYLISYNHLGPLINRINRENQIVWVRVTKGKILTFQVAKKGVYGQTKGVMHNKKADVINKGDYTVQAINGNPAIFVNDSSSHNLNLDHGLAWMNIFRKEKVSSGKAAYSKSKKVN